VAKPKATEREVRLARSFLKSIGGNQTNTYLLLAVIAWLRAMSKEHDPFFKTLSHYSAYAAGAKLAAKLKARVSNDKRNYTGVLASLRRAAKGDTALATQAVDFILAIEGSKWSRSHYGYLPYVEGHYATTTEWKYGYGLVTKTTYVPTQYESDPLRQAWAKLTNHPNIPNAWYTDTVTTKQAKVVPPRPSQPRSLLHLRPTTDYIQPYASRRFYESKPHSGDTVLPL